MPVDLDSIYTLLLPVTHERGADVDVDFLAPIAETFDGTSEEFVEYVRDRASEWYRSLGDGPNWMQEPEWQYFEGRPMVFVGALERRPRETGLHDDAVFYVFWDPPTGVTQTVIQLA